MARSSAATRRNFARPLVWAGLTVLVAALVVQTTRTGIDVLALLVAGFVLLIIERTIGDWVAETLGPLPTTLLFAAVAVLGVAYVTTGGGRARVGRLFAAAEARGYHSAYFSFDDGALPSSPPDVIGAVPGTLGRPSPAGSAASTSASAPAPPSQSVPSPGPSARPAAGPASTAGTPSAQGSAPRSVGPSNAAPTANGVAGPEAGGVRIGRLMVSPELAVVGQVVAIRATVSFDTAGTLPEVEFSIDGRPVASVRPGVDGIAAARWTTKVPGQYVIRARPAGGLLGSPGASATLNVLPGKRR